MKIHSLLRIHATSFLNRFENGPVGQQSLFIFGAFHFPGKYSDPFSDHRHQI